MEEEKEPSEESMNPDALEAALGDEFIEVEEIEIVVATDDDDDDSRSAQLIVSSSDDCCCCSDDVVDVVVADRL